MAMYTHTVGVILTDINGAIVGENGEPAYKFLSPSTRALDQAIMRQAIRTQENPIVVIGSNTFDEIKGTQVAQVLRDKKCPVIVSSKEGVALFENVDDSEPAKIWEFTDDQDPKEELKRITYASAYVGSDGKPYTIVVMGGHSVYEAFNFHYTEIHHTKYNKSINGERHIAVVGEDPRMSFDMSEAEPCMMIEDLDTVVYSDSDIEYHVYNRLNGI